MTLPSSLHMPALVWQLRPVRGLSARTALGALMVAIATILAISCRSTPAPAKPALSAVVTDAAVPLRAAFYYPWFPDAWAHSSVSPYTKYMPTQGLYDSGDPAVIRQHIQAMQYGNIGAGIASWWGQGQPTDGRLATILTASAGSGFKWAVYYEPEGQGDPSVSRLNADLTYLREHYASDPSYLRLGGRFVVFVYADAADGCGMADRWKQANTMNAYIVLKVFPGYASCASQPDGWHQYAPAAPTTSQGHDAFSISPGFDKVGEATRLGRDVTRWRQNIRDMVASGAAFQLVTTFNEWGEGTAVESATEWSSASGYGAFLDALHNNGVEESASAIPLSTATTGLAPSTAVPTPSAPLISSTEPAPGAAPGYNAAAPGPDAVLLAAGDIAKCASAGDQATAALLDGLAGTIAAVGDTAYEKGTPEEFSACYAPTWGRFLARTKPAPGNHEYLTKDASGYFAYFGAAAGDPAQGYYSYDLGAWHVVVINSNCSKIGGCEAGSPQERWLRADLLKHPALCTLAYWHHPRFSSGEHGNNVDMEKIWNALYDAGAEVVLNGHDHDYERFAPQTPSGVADAERGLREFVVGTGGANYYPVNTPITNSEVVLTQTFGILKLTLHAASYDWQFIPEQGKTVTDSGSGVCH